MNFRLLSRVLGIICLLIGGSMSVSLPFGFPLLANRTHLPAAEAIEGDGMRGLVFSMAISMLLGTVLMIFGRGSRGAPLFRPPTLQGGP